MLLNVAFLLADMLIDIVNENERKVTTELLEKLGLPQLRELEHEHDRNVEALLREPDVKVFYSDDMKTYLGLSERQLSYWGKKGASGNAMLVPPKREGMSRVYTKSDFLAAYIILEAKRQGVSLQKLGAIVPGMVEQFRHYEYEPKVGKDVEVGINNFALSIDPSYIGKQGKKLWVGLTKVGLVEPFEKKQELYLNFPLNGR